MGQKNVHFIRMRSQVSLREIDTLSGEVTVNMVLPFYPKGLGVNEYNHEVTKSCFSRKHGKKSVRCGTYYIKFINSYKICRYS